MEKQTLNKYKDYKTGKIFFVWETKSQYEKRDFQITERKDINWAIQDWTQNERTEGIHWERRGYPIILLWLTTE